MAKQPGTPKPKSGAPAQFDMNSRERKGGKGGSGGPGRGRDEKRPPSRIVSLPPTSVDRGEGWVIQKVGKVDQASHVAMGAEYHLMFEGHDALVFNYLSAARDRAKEPPPEKPEPAEATAEPAEEPAAPETAPPEMAGSEPPADEVLADEAPAHDAPAHEAPLPHEA